MGLMKFLGKTTSIVLMGVGLAGTAGFGALLGVGANATYEMTMPSGPVPGAQQKVEMGIGSINYGES